MIPSRFQCRIFLVILLLLTGLTLAGQTSAQDTNYWLFQYGTKAEMLTGVAAGSILDLSNTYYNPGAVPLLKDPSVVLTTFNFDINTITLEDGAGTGENLSSTHVNTSPGFLAGVLTFDILKAHRVAYSYLTQQRVRFNVNAKLIEERDITDDGSADDSFAGEVLAKLDSDENWGGLTWSRRESDNVGYGFTLYGAYKSQSSRFQTMTQAVTSDQVGASANIVDEFNFWNFRFLMKAGLSFDYNPLTFGFTVTTPSLGVLGSGSTFYNRSLIVPDLDGDGQADSELASNYQKDLSATYRTSWAVSGGLSYRFHLTTLHGMAEWFNAVTPYAVLNPEPFTAQTTGEVIDQTVDAAANSLVNFGVGVEQIVGEKTILYGSFITDKSYYSPESDISLGSWDLYHVTVGANFTFQGIEFTLGLEHAFGGDVVQRLVDLGTADPSNGLIGRAAELEASYKRWEIIVGFSFLL